MSNNMFKNTQDPSFDVLPTTNKWMDRIIEDHYSKDTLPKWIKVDEFYEELKKQLFDGIKWTFVCKSKRMYLGDWLTQLYSDHIDMGAFGGIEGKIEDKKIWVKIPDLVIQEVSWFYPNITLEFKEDKDEDEEEDDDEYSLD